MEYTSKYVYATNCSNVTSIIEDYQQHRDQVFIVVGSIITSIIALACIIGNLGVLLLYFFVETISVEPGNVPILYLALTDILNGIFIMVPSVITILMDTWIFGDIACHISGSLYHSFLTFSLVNIALINLDRLIAIRYFSVYRAKVTTNVMAFLCTILFLHSTVLGLFHGLPNWTTFLYSQAICGIDVTSDGVLPLIVYGVITCQIIPSSVIVICNVSIMKFARNSRRIAQAVFVQSSRDFRNANTYDQNRKTFKTMIVLIIAYHLCYTPYMIVEEMLFVWNIRVPLWIDYFCINILFLSSAINPLIYAIFRNDFRNGFKVLMRLFREKLYLNI